MSRRFVYRWKAPIVALIAAGLALISAANAFGNIWRSSDPGRLLRWQPDDARALLRRQDLAAAPASQAFDDPAKMAAIARQTLRVEPLSAPALRQLGLIEASSGRTDKALAFMQLAHRLTRRDLPTLLWSVYGTSISGDMGAMLGFADEALATSDAARDILFPGLATALSDPAMRRALVPYLRQDRPWMPGFIAHAGSSTASVTGVAALAMSAGGLPRTPGYAGLDTLILRQLVAKADFPMASAYVRQRTAGRADLARLAGFVSSTTGLDLGPFGWTYLDQIDRGAQLDAQRGLRVHVAADQRGTVAFRTILLPPGNYRFSHVVELPPGGAAAGVHWELDCIVPGSEERIWTLAVPVDRPRKTIVAKINVPDRCPAQKLILVADGSQDPGDSAIVIRNLEMRGEAVVPAATGSRNLR